MEGYQQGRGMRENVGKGAGNKKYELVGTEQTGGC